MMPQPHDALTAAMRFHEAGQFKEADQLYRHVLSQDPLNVVALHQAGMLAMGLGDLAQATQWLAQAAQLDRNRPEFHASLGEAYRRAGDLVKAAACTQHALKLSPTLAAAQANLGLIRLQQGDRRGAMEHLREATRVQPENAHFRAMLGSTLFECGQHADAEQSFRRALRIAPREAQWHFLLADVLHAQGRDTEAIEAYEAGLKLDPNQALAHSNVGTLYKDRKSMVEAEAHYRQALALSPDEPLVLSNLGSVLTDQGRHDEALGLCLKACELAPRLAAAQYNAGYAWQHLYQHDEAIAAFERAIALEPLVAKYHTHRAASMQVLGRAAEASRAFLRGVELDPENHAPGSNYLYSLHFSGEHGVEAIAEAHRTWGRKHADPLTDEAAPHSNDRDPNRRLRIGYVSAHFYSHAVNFFSEPILRSHDLAAWDVFCYSDVREPDQVTARLQPYAQWRNIQGRSDEEVAALVRGDRIDILVDLAGHIGGARLLVFAHKPAPVQVTYIGYQNTTGMRGMDYRLTDDWSDPPGVTDRYYTERLYRLPQTFFCYLPTPNAPNSPAPPVEANGFITFGSFNNLAKVTPTVLKTWAAILLDVLGSRLRIVAPASREVRRRFLAEFARHGISSERIELVDRCDREPYEEWIDRTDIGLDPFPFNGHTTTCDILWTGVPVVAMVGDCYYSRFGTSGHKNLGLDELLATSVDEYRRIAMRVASDIEQLRVWRRELRERMRRSAICDAVGFTRNLEAAYREMWRRWCAGV